MTLSDVGEITVEAVSADWLRMAPGLNEQLARVARAALDAACPGIGPAGIAIRLADDAAVQALNRDWRDQDRATNVLSFPATGTVAGETPRPPTPDIPLELGDVILAFETCQREALAAGRSLADHASHLAVHGTLHLIGYDHGSEDEALRMERLEALILDGFGIADPYIEPAGSGLQP